MRRPSLLAVFQILLTTIAGVWIVSSYRAKYKDTCCTVPLENSISTNNHPKERVFNNDNLENLLPKPTSYPDIVNDNGGNEELAVNQSDSLKTSDNSVNISSELSEAQQRIELRMRRMREGCAQLHDPYYHISNMYYFEKFNLAWCPTFKASSSTWRDFFIDELRGPDAKLKNGQHYHLAMLEEYSMGRGKRDWSGSPRKLKYSGEKSDSIRFTVVRHPLSRLISHLLKAQNIPYEVKRQKDAWVEEAMTRERRDPSWEESLARQYKLELDIYISELEPAVEHKPYSPDNPYLHPPYPTFVEMVNFIIRHRVPRVDNKGANGHWRSAVEWCDMCQNTFDIIIQLEQEPAELLVLLDKLGLMKYKDRLMQRHNASKRDASNSRTKAGDLMKEYSDMLNNEQIRFLNRMYEKDYRLLGYDPIPEH